jgi:hypothetical protein
MFGNNHCPSQAGSIGSGDLPFSASPTYCTENASGDAGDSNACDTLQSEWFTVEIPDGQVANIELNYPEEVQGADGDPVSTGDLNVLLYESLQDGSPASQAVAQSSRPPADESGTERIEYGVNHGESSPQPYFIQVRGSVPLDASPITYDLDVEFSAPVSCSQQDDAMANDFEENDNLQNPSSIQPLDPMDPAITGLRVCGGDEDFYELDVDANQVVDVAAKAPPRLGNIGLELIDPDSGTVVASSYTGDVTESVTYETDQPDVLVARVFIQQGPQSSSSGIGNVEYSFKWTQQPNPCADPFEPNNVCGTDISTLNNSSNGTSASFQDIPVCQTPNSPGEGDYYKFELDPLDELQVTVTYDQNAEQGVLQAILFGPNSCPTKLADAQESTNSQGETELTVNVPSSDVQVGGNYYLQVAIFQSNAEVNYDLSYTITPGPSCEQDQYDLGGSSNDSVSSAVSLSSQNIKNGGDDSVFNNLQICSGDSDYFCTNLDPSTNNSIEYEVRFDHGSSGQGDLSAFLVGPDQSSGAPNTVLDSSTSNNDDENVSLSGISQAGDYCVHVKSAGGTRNNYTLLPFVDGQGNPNTSCPDIYELNNQCSSVATCNAASFPTNQLEANLLACSGDNDWYEVSAEPGQEMTATLSYDTSSGGGIVDMELYEETTLGSGRVDFTSGASSPKQLTWEATRQQSYFVNVYTTTRNYYAFQIDEGPISSCTDDPYDTGGSSNDSSSEAVEVASPGLEVSRRICDSNEDWYKFDVDSGANFEVFANYDYGVGDVDITVYGPGGTSTQVGAGTTMTDDESVVVNDPAGGTYYVKVAAKNPARVDYDLLIYEDLDGDNNIEPSAGEGPEDKQCPDRFENNDTAGEAAQAAIRNYDRLTMCASGGTDDKDYYRIYVPQDSQLSADLAFTHDEGDIDMRLYEGTSASGTPVATSTTDTDGESLSMSSFSTGRDYLLEVVGDTSTSGSDFRTMYGMNLSLNFSGTCTDDTFAQGAGNHNPLNAASLNVEDYDAGYDLKICEDPNNPSSGLEDWFTFTTGSQDDALLSLDHKATQGEIEMELIDEATGGTVATSSAKYGSTDNVQEIDVSGLAAGTYNLRIASATGSPIRNEYDLYAEYGGSTPTQPYCPDVYERNDKSGSGTPASLNFPAEFQFTDGRVCGSEDDWYTVDLQSGTTYRLETYFQHSASSDVDVQILDPSGNIVTDLGSTQASFVNSSSDNDELWAFTPSTSGTFKIGLRNSGNGDVSAPFQIAEESMYSTGTASADCPSDIAASSSGLAPFIGPSLPYTNGFALCSSDDYVRWTAPSNVPSDVQMTVYHDNTDYPSSFSPEPTSLNFGIDVEQSDGTGVAQELPPDLSSAPRDNRSSVTFTPTGGTTYVIKVQRGLAAGTNDSTHGPYILDIEWVNP